MAASGSVGYVGLIVPHLVRLSVGSDNRLVVPFSAVAGRYLSFCGHDRADGDRSEGIAGRSRDGADRRADVYIFVEEELAAKRRKKAFVNFVPFCGNQ